MPKDRSDEVAKSYYVCIVQAGDYVKVGCACDVDRRITEMQTGNPHEIKELARLPFHTKNVAFGYEKDLHYRLRHHHYRGEWFREKCKDLVFKQPGIETSKKQKKRHAGLSEDKRWEKVRSAPRITNPSNRTKFYDDPDIPPWDESLGEFQEL